MKHGQHEWLWYQTENIMKRRTQNYLGSKQKEIKRNIAEAYGILQSTLSKCLKKLGRD
jgi:arginine repressor